jgi:hypothetical protein
LNRTSSNAESTGDSDNWGDSPTAWALDALASWIRYAEVKVAAILAITGILVSALFEKLPQVVSTAQAACPLLAGCILATLLVYVCAQLGVVVSALVVLWPRLRSTRPSLFHFDDISSMSYEEFRDSYQRSDGPKLLEHAVRQIYDNARVARAKFVATRWCIALLMTSLVPWIILMLVA